MLFLVVSNYELYQKLVNDLQEEEPDNQRFNLPYYFKRL